MAIDFAQQFAWLRHPRGDGFDIYLSNERCLQVTRLMHFISVPSSGPAPAYLWRIGLLYAASSGGVLSRQQTLLCVAGLGGVLLCVALWA